MESDETRTFDVLSNARMLMETDAEKADRWCETAEQYKTYNFKLEAENGKLKAEVEQLKIKLNIQEMAVAAMAEKIERLTQT